MNSMGKREPKIAILFDFSNSPWVSCNTISANLLSAYELTNLEIHKLSLSCKTSKSELITLAETIIDHNFTHLIFIDHRFTPGALLYELAKKTKILPQIFIHIYGDFFYNRNLWASENETLKNYIIQFICASRAQSEFIGHFIEESQKNSIVHTIAFPVSKKLSFDEELRKRSRQNFELSDETFVLCYSGRISLQKNVLDILSAFDFLVEFIPNLKLFIAGPFDDIGIPYIGLSRLPLTMEYEFYSYWENLPSEVRQKIFYLGNLNQEELLHFYHASDAYISFSSHNDEDFGMAPAEALCAGLPLILSNWGAFPDFKKNGGDFVQLIDVEIQGQKIKPTKSVKQKLLQTLMKNKILTNEERKEISLKAFDHYLPQAISERLKDVFNADVQKFEGFNSLFFTTVMTTNKLGPFQNSSNSFTDLYKQLYDCYFNKGES